MADTDNEHKYLYISSMMIVFCSGFGAYSLFNNELVAVSVMFVLGGFLVFLRTIMTIKVAELELKLTPVTTDDS